MKMRLRSFAAAAAVLVLIVAGVAAQDTPQPAPPPDELTADQIRALKDALEADEAIDAAAREEAARVYDAALAEVTARSESRARRRQFDAATGATPENLQLVRAELESLPAQLPLPVSRRAPLGEIQDALQAAEAEAAAAATRIAELRAESTRRETARRELPDRIATARQRLNAPIEDELLVPSDDDPPVVREAREVALTARRQALGVELRALESELESYVRRVELMQARIELAERNERLATDLVTRLRDLLTTARTRDAEAQAEQAEAERLAAAGVHEVVSAVAELNAELARRRVGEEGIPARLEATQADLVRIRVTLDDVESDFAGVQARISKVGMTDAVGLMLRRKRDALPAVAFHRDRIRAREDLLGASQLEFLDIEDKLKSLSDLDAAVASRMLAVTATGRERADIEESLRRQLEAKRGYLQALSEDYDAYVAALFDLDETERGLVSLIEDYRSFVAERILWIRSAGFVGPADAGPAARALAWLFSPSNWGTTFVALKDDLVRHPVRIVFALLVLALTVLAQPFARRRIRKTSDIVSNHRGASFWYTVQCFAVTLLAVLPGPLAMWIGAWRLQRATDIGEFGIALATALNLSALMVLGIGFLWKLGRPNGLGSVHFSWPEVARAALRRHMVWMIPVVLPLLLIFSMVTSQPDESFESSLGRVLVMALTLTAVVFTHLVFRPRSVLMSQFAEQRKGEWVMKGAYGLYALLMLVPLLICVLAGIGFTYTAAELLVRYAQSVLFGIGLVVANGMMHRWFELSEQRIAARARKRKLKQKQTQAQMRAAGLDPTDDESAPLPEEEINIEQLRHQTRSLRQSMMAVLFVTGFFLIWTDVLPALGFLDSIHLWTYTTDVMAEDGTVSAAVTPVTLGRVLLSFAVVVMTVVIARTLPGLLDTTVLTHLKTSQGARYALKSIMRYVLAGIGAVLAFQAVGVGWSDVQWLVAGFSVGLGFGLTEIFANFISGLILLIERPIRVGDTVTVGGVTGRVTRINMRSTTIEDWDRKELVVPNKSFITSELVNWTLSSDVLRMVIKVGVAYGSDLKKVEETLLRVARANSRVLKSPEPHTMFQQFGDSTLDWELRVFVGTIKDFRYLRDALHKDIDAAFREEGIEIAFPQRTLWVRDFEAPLTVKQDSPKES